MKLFRKILKWFFISLSSVLLLGFIYVYFIFLARPGEVYSINEISDSNWHTVLLDGETSCSDGSEYYIFTKRGKSDNLIIHFAGGGACWDDITCFSPITLTKIFFDRNAKDLTGFYFPDIPKLVPALLTGIFDGEFESNPFKDWNVVYIPYCTGDLHVGNITNMYSYEGQEFKIEHKGRSNTIASLQWIKENFNDPNKVLVSGESAGAYASAFWTPYISTKLEYKNIYQLSDAVLLSSTRWSEIMDTVWNAESQSFLGFQIGSLLYENSLLNRLDSVRTPIKYLHSNTKYDFILPKFSSALNHTSTETNDYINNWSRDMLVSMEKLSNSNLDYQYFISDCKYDSLKHSTPHTLIGNPLYNSCSTDQLTYVEWLEKNVINDEPISVGSQFFK